jgi:hypothetical protein
MQLSLRHQILKRFAGPPDRLMHQVSIRGSTIQQNRKGLTGIVNQL